MMRAFWVLLVLLVQAGPALAQSGVYVHVPVHNSMAFIGTATGTINALPSRSRSYLKLINHSSALMFCTVDGTEAQADLGIRLDVHGGSITFQGVVPRGPVRCYSGTNGSRLLTVEGQ